MDATHPTDQTLRSYGLGKLDEASAEAVNTHLEQCPDCRARVAEMSSDRFLDRVRDAQKGSGQSRTGVMPAGNAKKAPVPPPADTLPPGLVDHPDYEIKKELGRGGMGVVYLAHNTLMDRDEVLKVMSRQIIEQPGVLDRFLREIRAVARLRHPNIVTAHHATRLGESLVFAMEYVEGLDLARLVEAKGPLPVAHACNFAYQAALGLQHAHEEGLVHRDIKPGNLMLARRANRPIVKVLDFGLAKATRETPLDKGLTNSDQMLGTPAFIAPEQIRDAQTAGIRADIYSLGCTLYYLLTGAAPFEGTNLYATLQAHFSMDAQPLNLIRPEVPAELAALVARIMAKDLDRRFQTPREVADALTPFFKKISMPAKNPRADVSRSGASTLPSPPLKVFHAPTQPATDLKPARSPAKPAAASQIESKWESLAEILEIEPESEPEPEVGGKRGRPWVWPLVAVGVLILGLAGAAGWGVQWTTR